ncbi:MAG: TonB-dependent receptor [Candidatus Acidiferrales bacterium]
MRLERLRAIAVGSLLGLFFAVPVSTQAQFHKAPSGSLSGTLTDPSGAAIAGAKIIAEPGNAARAATAPSHATQSGPDGKFMLELEPGRYTVKIDHQSFEPAAKDFTIAASESQSWDVRLVLRTASSTVVVSALTAPTEAESSPYPVTVLSREDIRDRQELWLAPMLATGGGVNINREGAFGGITTLFLDGGNSNFTKVLIDGAPANQPGGDIDLEGFDLDNVDKVEIVHGASSALYGSDAMTGVVEIFTHRGTTSTPVMSVFADGGTFGSGRGGGRISGVAGAFDYSASASYFSTVGQGANDYFRNTAVSGNFGYRFSENNRIHVTLRNDSNDGGQPGQMFEPTPTNHINQHNFFASALWEFAHGPHWKYRLQGTDAYIRQSIFDTDFDFNTFNRFYRTGLDARASYVEARGGVTVGYTYEVENGEPGGPPHVRRNNQAGYVEGRYQPGRRVMVTAGGRVEDNASFGTKAVPRAGISYAARYGHDFWGATRLRASFGLGIKEPTFVQSFENDPCFPGNPNLRPERSTTVDAGIEQMLASDRLRVSVTYFHNDFHDIVSFGDTAPTDACPFGTGSFFNTDKARAYGAISAFEAKVTKWFRVTGNYTYDNSRVLVAPNAFDPTLAPGNRLFHRPLHSANLTFNARIRRINWMLAGTYVGRATDSDFQFPPLGITSNPSWVRWDMAAVIPIQHGFSFTSRVENLFDRQYQDAVGYPALGRNFRLGMKYVWGRE